MGPILGGGGFLRYTNAGVNIIFHGNSLVYGQSGATVPTGAMPYQVQRLPPVNNLVNCVNEGANGRNWDGMLSSAGFIDSLFDSAKVNILVAWEGTNSINSGLTAAQAFAKAQTYTAARLSAHPAWRVIHMTCLPIYYQHFDDATAASVNAVQNAYSQLLRDGWRDMGAKGLVDVQQVGSPFLLPNYNRTTFQAALYQGQSIWSPNDQEGGGGTGQNQFVHASDYGYAYLASVVAPVLRRLPR